MNRGVYRCIVKIEYKAKGMDDRFIAPNEFDQTFEDLEIISGGQLILVEMRTLPKINEFEDMSDDE